MSAFANALESADDIGYENNAPLANGEETQTVANEIAEVQGLAQEAADADNSAETLDDEAGKTEELAENLEKDVAAEAILDPTAAKFLALAFKNIVGKRHAAKTLPATESWSGNRAAAKESTRLALEGIKDTLKSFWEAIKAQFKKVYSKVKSWIIKTFSAAKKLKGRAETLQKRANDTIGTMEEKTFSFSQTKAIAVDGKYNDAGAVLGGLTKVRGAIEATLTALKKSDVDDAVEKMIKEVEGSFSGTGATRTISITAFVHAIASITAATVKGNNVPTTVGDQKKYAEQYGTDGEVSVAAEVGFPGGKAIVKVEAAASLVKTGSSDLEGVTKIIKASRTVLGNDKFTPRDVTEGDVKTLTTSQIDKVCDDVIEIAESVYTYEKAWESRDKFVEKVIKDTDQMVKDLESEDGGDSRHERHFRSYVGAQVGVVRRMVSFEANLCSYALTTANAFLNYSERSLAQHKAK